MLITDARDWKNPEAMGLSCDYLEQVEAHAPDEILKALGCEMFVVGKQKPTGAMTDAIIKK